MALEIRQIGAFNECGRKNCKSEPRYRIIWDTWQVQIYVCSRHLKWGIDIQLLTESRKESLGLTRQPHRYGERSDAPMVDSLLPLIQSADFQRDIASQVSNIYPQPDSQGRPFIYHQPSRKCCDWHIGRGEA